MNPASRAASLVAEDGGGGRISYTVGVCRLFGK